MNRPTPNSDELPSTVRPRTLDIEPSANTPAAMSPATPNQVGSRRVRSPARETAAVSAVMVHTIGIRPCRWLSARTARGGHRHGHGLGTDGCLDSGHRFGA
jgi:hypothetical protein